MSFLEQRFWVGLGGLLPIYLLSLLFGRIFFKNSESSNKIIYSTLIAYVVGCILSGFGNMNGGGISAFSPFYLEYLFSSVVLITIRLAIAQLKKDS